MSLSSDRAEMLARLRSSNNRDLVLTAAKMFKVLASAIFVQNPRSSAFVNNCLEASLVCMCRFNSDEDILEALMQAICTVALVKKEFAQTVCLSGTLTLIISAMKTFPRNANLNVAAVRILYKICLAEKRASVIIRVQGGVVAAVELLAHPGCESDQKITRHVIGLISLMIRRSSATAAVIAEVGGIEYIIQATRRHLSNSRIFQLKLVLFERLCANKVAVSKLAGASGFVQIFLDALCQYKYIFKTFTVLLRILKTVAGLEAGARAIEAAGGFGAILTLIEHHLVKPAAFRLACSLLWHLQRHDFGNVFADEKLYHLQSNYLTLKLPQAGDLIEPIDDGYASDDSFTDHDADEDDDAKAAAASRLPPKTNANEIQPSNWNSIQFAPELWLLNEVSIGDFFERSSRELRSTSRPKSIRALLPHPKSMIMLRENGRPGNESFTSEYQYLPLQSHVLATMHAAGDRFRVGRRFQARVIYDRGLHDGNSLQLPAFRTQPKTVYGADQAELSDDDSDESEVYPQFQNLAIEAREYFDPSPDRLSRVPALAFESRFESGNLFRAVMAGETEYDLVLSSDINTVGRTQWFLFRVENIRADVEYKFNIINLEKPDSAYNRGMRPVMYSELSALSSGKRWFRPQTATDIAYFQNYFKKPHAHLVRKKPPKTSDDEEHDYYQTLTFTITFPYSDDTVFLAYFYPFTFSYQQHCLSLMDSCAANEPFLRRQVLCYSLGGNVVDLLTITDFKSSVSKIEQRPVIILSARIHPGETNSSWVMKGVLEFLTGSSDTAHFLRENIVFKIIPMLNPDGVIEGNYRCSLSGHDQNRQWDNPNEASSPVVFNARRLILSIAQSRQLLMFCDFHGHSVSSNFMIYGNDESECAPGFKPVHSAVDGKIRRPAWMSTVGSEFANKERIFPAMLARRAYQLFSLEQCCFTVQKTRAGTARVAFWRELPLSFCFTLEATFNGSSFGPLKGLLYNTDHYETMGHEFCRTIADLISPDQDFVSRAASKVACTSNADSAKLKKRNVCRKMAESKPGKGQRIRNITK